MNKLERTKNSIRNFIWGLLNKGVSLLLPFFIRTIIVNALGREYLGLNNLFTSILNVLNLAELGIGSAMVYAMYKPIAEGNKDQICGLLTLYRRLYRIIGLVILVIGLLLVPFLPYLINGGVEGISITVLYLIYLANTVLSYWMFAYKQSLLTAHQRTDITSNVGTIIHLLLNLTQVIILLVFKNYYLYCIVMPFFTIINNVTIYFVTKKLYPEYSPKGEVSKEVKHDIYQRTRALVGHKLGTTVVTSADSLVISAFLGLSVVGIYSNYHYIIYFVVSISQILFNGMLAGIGNSLITENEEKNYSLFMNINFMALWFVSWCSVCLLCLFQPFMTLWMGESMLLPISSVVLMVIYYYTWQARVTGLYFKDAAGMWQADFWKPYVSAVFNLIVNIVLVNLIGINGVFISTIICMSFINFPWETVVLFKQLFKRSCIPYLRDQAINLIITIPMCVISYFICFVAPSGFWGLVVRMIICIVVPNIIFVAFNFRRPEFKYLMEKVYGIIGGFLKIKTK